MCLYSFFSKKKFFYQQKIIVNQLEVHLQKLMIFLKFKIFLPDSILHTRLMQQLLVYYKFRFVNDTRYYWIDRTTDTPDPNTISERLLKTMFKNTRNN